MRTAYIVLCLPLLFFLALAATLDLAALQQFYPRSDLTPFLAAQSLAEDWDLAYSRVDSDRYFKRELRRPAGFFLKQKKIISSSGNFRSYSVFYCPDLYVFALIPFVKLFSFPGVILLHSLLAGSIYLLGYLYYKREKDGFLPAGNSVVYYTLVPVPILLLIPEHPLFLFAAVTAAIF
ncbi:MAG TPA: hypothetical protein VI728_09930, partial [Syntrophales bacterium]|nr:hypothetical protein [Syntrophales bacterium]